MRRLMNADLQHPVCFGHSALFLYSWVLRRLLLQSVLGPLHRGHERFTRRPLGHSPVLRRHQRHPRRRGRNLHPPPLHRFLIAADSSDVLLLLSRRPRVVHLPFRGAVRGPVRRRRRATDRLGVGAHVAHLLAPAASTRGSLLAEVTQQNRPPARPNRPSVRVDRAAVTAIHLPELVQLVRTAVQDASRGQRVPPGPSALLVHALEG
mmetsp:Transcript_11538/g.53649  ORF Transcript_11538/g.53649 Transcript_11538/m.53649 type:complete len:207 (-) Transcript_11538:1423-2043(-)